MLPVSVNSVKFGIVIQKPSLKQNQAFGEGAQNAALFGQENGMKKVIAAMVIFSGAVEAYAQGQLYWGDGQRNYLIAILSPNPADPALEQTGNTSMDTPAGSTTYGGGWIGGTATPPGGGVGPTPSSGVLGLNFQQNANFEVGLYLATSQAALTTDILTEAPLTTGTILGNANAGLYAPASSTYTTAFAVGTPVYVGIAAWDTINGAASSPYTANGDKDPYGYIESSSPVTLGPGGSPAGLANIGLTSFSLEVPEPSTLALGVVGASIFLMRLRRTG